LKRISSYIKILLVVLTVSTCSDETIVEPDVFNGGITGQIKFIDGTPGAFARVNLQNLFDNRTVTDTADQNGMFEFGNLKSGDYILSFLSTGYDIHTFRIDITLPENETIYQDLYIVYKMLDDEKARTVNDSLVLIKYHRDVAGIGDNYQVIENLTGYYGGDLFNDATLSCEIYELPNDFNWTETNIELTPDSVRENFVYVMEIDDTLRYGNHEIVFTGEDIQKILSNPGNGFVFVNKGEEGRSLKIPCVDRLNNDFGLIINYK